MFKLDAKEQKEILKYFEIPLNSEISLRMNIF